MKKVNIDLMLGRRTRCHYRRTIQRTILIYSFLPATKATKVSLLAPILTRYGLDSESIYTQFNKRTLNWLPGIQIPVAITVNTGKTFVLETKLPPIYAIINVIWNFGSKETGVIEIEKKAILAACYKIALIKAKEYLYEKKLKKWVSQILGTFKSYNVFSYRRRYQKKINYKKRKK